MALSFKQLEERRGYVGGSDAPIICGVSPFKNVIELWQEKIGESYPEDISDKPHVKAGNFLENGIMKWFAHETGFECWHETNTVYCNEIQDQEFMAANIDAWVRTPDFLCPLEIKTTSSDKDWGETGSSKIPDMYLLQVVHYMAVTGAPRAYVAVLIRGVDFRWYVIERHEKLEEILIAREQAFWRCVEERIPPEPSNGEEIISLYRTNAIEESVIADHETEWNLDRLEEINFEISALQREKDELSDKIKAFMGQNDTLLNSSGKISATWKKMNKSKRFDVKKFREEKPDDYDKYSCIVTDSRRFLLKNNARTNI